MSMPATRPQSRVDRSVFTFGWNGRLVPARPGDTVAEALFRAGIHVTGTSRKRHRPMGLSGAFVQGTLATIDNVPNQRLDQVIVRPGMQVTRQNVWPSQQVDLLGLFRYLPARWVRGGFEHTRLMPSGTKRFRRWERLLAFLAGEGILPAESVAPPVVPGQKLTCDLAVIGGGPAGQSAANAAAAAGKRVVLIARGRKPGRFATAFAAGLVPLHPAVTLLAGHEACGIYRDGKLVLAAPLVSGPAIAIDCAELVLAIGKRSCPPLVRGNLLPGVLEATTAMSLASRPEMMRALGRVVVIGTEGREVIADRLRAFGVEIVAVVRHDKLRRIMGTKRVDAVDLDGPVACETLVHAGPWVTDPNLPFQARSDGSLRLTDQPMHRLNVIGAAAEPDEPLYYDPAMALDADICPCMDVTVREVTELLEAEMTHAEELKRQTSCGMGPCQGFPCWEMLSAVCRHHLGPDYRPDRPSHRAPRRNLTVAQAAGLHDVVEPVK